MEWLTEAQRLCETDDTVDVYFVQSQLLDIVKIVIARLPCSCPQKLCKNFSHALIQHDDPGNTRELSEAYFFTKPLLSLESMKRGKTQKVSNALYEKYVGKGRNSSYWEVNYWGLCRGANLLVSCRVLGPSQSFCANFNVLVRLRKPLPISSVGLSSKYIKFTLLVHSKWSS